MSQEFKQKQTQKSRQDDVSPSSSPNVAIKDEKIAAEVEAVLDEIDEILEENAEEFVANYRQKGGQ